MWPRALTLLLAETDERRLHARAASDNEGSLRVLAKCGFVLELPHGGVAALDDGKPPAM